MSGVADTDPSGRPSETGSDAGSDTGSDAMGEDEGRSEGGVPDEHVRPAAPTNAAAVDDATPAIKFDPDELAALEDEQRFLLRSIADLDREHEAGDVDDVDYRTLKDGYTARAAAVIKAIEAGRRAVPPRRRPRWGRIAMWVATVAVVAVGAGLLVAHLAGQRLPGQTLTGGIAQDTNSQLATARSLLGSDPNQSLSLYTQVLQVDPDNVEARTYTGWLLAIQASANGNRDLVLQAESLLDKAIELGPTRADAYCFKAVVRFRFLDDPTGAKAALAKCQALHPPSDVASLLSSLAADIAKAPATPTTAASSASTVVPATTAASSSTVSTTRP